MEAIQPYVSDAWLWARANPLQGLAALVGVTVLLKFFAWLLSIFRIGG